MSKLSFAIPLGVALLLAACGTTQTERGVSGGAIGAGVGAAGAAVTGGSTLGGALIGGATGAAVGVLTDSDDIDLGPLPRLRSPIY